MNNFSIDATDDQTTATTDSIGGSGQNWFLTLGTVAGSGSLSVDLDLNLSNITDGMGNALAASYTGGETYNVDRTAPTVTSITRQTPLGEATKASQVVFAVTFDEGVTGVAADNFSIDADGAQTTASVNSVGGSGQNWTVAVDTVADDGSLSIDLDLNLSNITDAVGNALLVSYTGGEAYNVDWTAPTATSITRQTPADQDTNAAQVVFALTFDEDVTGVATNNFSIDATDDQAAATVNSVGGAGQDWTVVVDTVPGGGSLSIDLGLNLSNITDGAGNALTVSYTGGETYNIDRTAPTVSSITRSSPAGSDTGAAQIVFAVTFDKNVTGVATNNFSIDATGDQTTASVTSVGGSGQNWTVTVDSVAGSGFLSVDLSLNLTNIIDGLGNSLSAFYFDGETYNVDRTAPEVTSITRQTPLDQDTDSLQVVFAVTFDESVTGVAADNFSIDATDDQAAASVISVEGSGQNWTVTVDTASGSGSLSVDLNLNLSNITDGLGNAQSAFYVDGETYNVDRVGPQVTSITRHIPSEQDTSASQVFFAVTFDESTTGVAADNFSIDATDDQIAASVTGVGGSGQNWIVTADTVSGGGLLSIDFDLNLSNITDALGNAATASYTGGEAYNIERIAPRVTSITRQAPLTHDTNAAEVVFAVTFDKSVTGVAADNFSIDATDDQTAAIVTGTDGSGRNWTVTVDTVVGSGLLGVDLALNLPNIIDDLGNPLSEFYFDGRTYNVDRRTPEITSITRQTPLDQDTNAAQVVFAVNFDEAVTGVAVGNFSIDATGDQIAASVISVDGAGQDWTVTVDTAAGDGSLSIDLDLNLSSITDVQNNAFGTSYALGEIYNIDSTAPETTSIIRSSPLEQDTNAAQVVFAVTFNESVTGVAIDNFSLDATEDQTTASVTSVGGSGQDWTITVDTVKGSGSLSIDLNLSLINIVDAAGNALGASFSDGEAYNIDRIAPTVTSVTVQPDGLSVDVTFSEAVMPDGAMVESFYVSGPGIGSLAPDPHSIDVLEVNIYRLSWTSGEMLDGGEITVTVINMQDLAGNALGSPYSGTDLGIGFPPEIDISDPLPSVTNGVDVSFMVNYTGADAVTLSREQILVLVQDEPDIRIIRGKRLDHTPDITAPFEGNVVISGEGTEQRTITLSGLSQSGLISVAIDQGTANDLAGNVAPSIGPSNAARVDLESPSVVFLTVLDEKTAQIKFSESMGAGVTDPLNYTVPEPGEENCGGTLSQSPDDAVLFDADQHLYTLSWLDGEMCNDGIFTIAVNDVEDLAGNPIGTPNSASTVVLRDGLPPEVTSVTVISPLGVDIVFNEAMGGAVSLAANYTLSGSGKGTLADHPASVNSRGNNTYRLMWASGTMVNGGDITITVENVSDSEGIAIADKNFGTDVGGAIGVAPQLTSAIVRNTRVIDVTFSKKMGAGVGERTNYQLTGNGMGSLSANPDEVVHLSDNTYRLQWNAGEMLSGNSITITVSDVPDAAGNLIGANNSKTVAAVATAPTVVSVVVQPDGLSVKVTFSETMGAGVNDVTNYVLSGAGQGWLASEPNEVVSLGSNTYQLKWHAGEMLAGLNIQITVLNVQDLAGNLIGSPNSGTDVAIGTKPTVDYIEIRIDGSIAVKFSEIMGESASMPANYTLAGPGAGDLNQHPDEVELQGTRTYSLIWFSGEKIPGATLTVIVSGVADLTGNLIGSPNSASATVPEAPPQKPVITSGPVVVFTGDTSAIIEWETNIPADSLVEYGTTDTLGQSEPDSDLTTEHVVNLEGLSSGTDYFAQVSSKDRRGFEAVQAGLIEFTTLNLPDDTPPVFTSLPLAIDVSDREASFFWTTDEPSTSQVSVNGADILDPDDSLLTEHLVRVSGFLPSTMYAVTVSSLGASGNGPTTSAPFTFTTASTPDIYAPVISEGPLGTSVTADSAIIYWLTDESADTTVQYGKTSALELTAHRDTMTSTHNMYLVELEPNTKYFYRALSTDTLGNGPVVSKEYSFTTGSDPDIHPPVFIEEPSVVYLTNTFAMVRWVTDEPSDTAVEYAQPGGELLRRESAQKTTVHIIALVNLEPGKTYEFIASSTDSSGNTAFSSLAAKAAGISFTTLTVPDEAPPVFVQVPGIAAFDSKTALVFWGTDEVSDSRVEYGLSSGALDIFAANAMPTTEHVMLLTNLEASKRYFIQVSSTDPSGNGPATSSVISFTTSNVPDTGAPGFLSSPAVAATTQKSASVQWTTNEPATSQIRYGKTSGNYSVSATSVGLSSQHAVTLTNLVPGEMYYYVAVSLDYSGNEAVSGESEFFVRHTADINADRALNAVDVQLVINAALGIDIEYDADVDEDGAINAVDVQKVINAVLGIGGE